MTSYDDFLSRVLPEVPGCPELVAIQAIRDTAIQFCKESLIHQVNHDPIGTVAKKADYDLESPVEQTRVYKIMSLWFGGNKLTPASPDMVVDPTVYAQNIGGKTTTYSTPQFYTQKDDVTVTLTPIPDQTVARSITMRVALVPTRDSSSCEDFLYEDWVEPIAFGAVARLMQVPGKAYTNPQASTLYQGRFIVGLNAARQQASRGRVRGDLRVKMRRI